MDDVYEIKIGCVGKSEEGKTKVPLFYHYRHHEKNPNNMKLSVTPPLRRPQSNA